MNTPAQDLTEAASQPMTTSKRSRLITGNEIEFVKKKKNFQQTNVQNQTVSQENYTKYLKKS